MEDSDILVREPLPWGLPLTRGIWIPAALLLASLPLVLGARAALSPREDSTATATTRLGGWSLALDSKDEAATDGPVSLRAFRCELSGTFPFPVSFRGRKLVLAPGFRAPALDVHCAIIEGDRSGVGELRGSYQRFR